VRELLREQLHRLVAALQRNLVVPRRDAERGAISALDLHQRARDRALDGDPRVGDALCCARVAAARARGVAERREVLATDLEVTVSAHDHDARFGSDVALRRASRAKAVALQERDERLALPIGVERPNSDLRAERAVALCELERVAPLRLCAAEQHHDLDGVPHVARDLLRARGQREELRARPIEAAVVPRREDVHHPEQNQPEQRRRRAAGERGERALHAAVGALFAHGLHCTPLRASSTRTL
jgi:hypothetical protein